MSDAIETINALIKIVDSFKETTSISLPEYTKKTMIASRVYIQDTLFDNASLTDTLKVLHNLYIGYILTALQLNQYVTKNKTIRDMLSVVSTEGLVGDTYIGAESIGSHFKSTFFSDPDNERRLANSTQQSKIIENKDKQAFPSGKLVEVTFNNPEDPKQTFTTNIFVQLLSRSIPSEIMEQFIALNFKPALKQRWLQYKVDEIRFWKDFVLQLDILEKRREAMKKDKSGDLLDMLRAKQNAITKHLSRFIRALHFTSIFDDDTNDLLRKIPDRHNIANSILIYEKGSFDRYCHDSHLDFKRFNDRQKFFNASYSMIVVVMDTMYNDITMYFNSFEAFAKYSFSQMADSASRDTMNLVTVMKQMSQGQAPRF